jgi:alkanesulfonate monooxygenase SsuD/methylene tetrahydromethanopterin reductase-like flavin-dependent oxidoreductase (luciferase family)
VTARWAESVGFDSLWLYDHVLFRSPGWPDGTWECWTVLSALAEATQRVELGTLVLCNSFRNPALVAKMATTLDEVSDGRLILGLGAGWHDAEFAALRVPFDHRVDRFEEALQILHPPLRRERVEFASRYYAAHGSENTPRGPRPAGPPLLVGAEGPRMLRLAARSAYRWNIGFLGMPDVLVGPKAELRTACAEVGRDPATIAITALVGVGYPEEAPIPPRFGENGFVTGSPREVCAVIRGNAQLGARHIMFDCAPDTPTVRARVAEGVRLFRAGAPARETPAQPLSARWRLWPWRR